MNGAELYVCAVKTAVGMGSESCPVSYLKGHAAGFSNDDMTAFRIEVTVDFAQ